VLVAAWLLMAAAARADSRAAAAGDLYRADVLAPIPARPPEEVQLFAPDAPGSWPQAIRARFEERIRREWPAAQIYGPLHSSLGIWLQDSLVTAQVGGRVLVPVIDGASLPIRGRLVAPEPGRARRVVVLVDASASANALTSFAAAGGSAERIAILEAERRALDHLVELLGSDRLEVGVIAFGESTIPVAEPGLDHDELRARLERFRAERPRGEGRTDAVCALWTARDWLLAAPGGVEREVVVLTDGDLPYSGRFAECDGPSARRVPGAERACNERRNRSRCPASRELRSSEGSSDLAQLGAFARETRGQLRITPLVFDHERPARVWEQLARRSGSNLVRVPSPQAVEAVLPALVSSQVRGVRVRNATTGQESQDLLEPASASFSGDLPLQRGANDVELRVESERGLAALLRFRVYSEPGHLGEELARLRSENVELEARARELQTLQRRPVSRRLEIRVPASGGF
jgi:hypothetical protein